MYLLLKHVQTNAIAIKIMCHMSNMYAYVASELVSCPV